VEVSTSLIYPPDSTSDCLANTITTSPPPQPSSDVQIQTLGLSASRLSAHNSVESAKERHPADAKETPATLDQIVVHIEVTDTGVGIRTRDLVDQRLFSPYVQTEIGRHQVRGLHGWCNGAHCLLEGGERDGVGASSSSTYCQGLSLISSD